VVEKITGRLRYRTGERKKPSEAVGWRRLPLLEIEVAASCLWAFCDALARSRICDPKQPLFFYTNNRGRARQWDPARRTSTPPPQIADAHGNEGMQYYWWFLLSFFFIHSFGTIVPQGGIFFYYVGTIIPEGRNFFIMLEQFFQLRKNLFLVKKIIPPKNHPNVFKWDLVTKILSQKIQWCSRILI
jgi:hypothetical protein